MSFLASRLLPWLLIGLATHVQANSGQTHPLAQEMFKRGAINCAPAAHQLSSLLSTGKDVSLLQLHPDAPNQAISQGTLVQSGDKGVSLVNMTMAPNASGCSAGFRVIVYVDNRCSKAAEEKYPGQKPRPIEKTGAWLINPTPTVQALLVPAGKGCLIMNEEIIR
jgi:hypothetical protein